VLDVEPTFTNCVLFAVQMDALQSRMAETHNTTKEYQNQLKKEVFSEEIRNF